MSCDCYHFSWWFHASNHVNRTKMRSQVALWYLAFRFNRREYPNSFTITSSFVSSHKMDASISCRILHLPGKKIVFRYLASELRALCSGYFRLDFLSTAHLPQRDVSTRPHVGTMSQPWRRGGFLHVNAQSMSKHGPVLGLQEPVLV